VFDIEQKFEAIYQKNGRYVKIITFTPENFSDEYYKYIQRPYKPEGMVSFTVSLPKLIVDKLDKYKGKRKRSDFIGFILEKGEKLLEQKERLFKTRTDYVCFFLTYYFLTTPKYKLYEDMNKKKKSIMEDETTITIDGKTYKKNKG
jgi:hypothetical protein